MCCLSAETGYESLFRSEEGGKDCARAQLDWAWPLVLPRLDRRIKVVYRGETSYLKAQTAENNVIAKTPERCFSDRDKAEQKSVASRLICGRDPQEVRSPASQAARHTPHLAFRR